MRSLRHRAIAGGLIWAAMIVAIGGVALFYFFDALTLRRFDTALFDRYLQVVAALGNSGGEIEQVETYLTDPAYSRPYSGRYWQIVDSNGQIAVSRSLFDALLPTPDHAAPNPVFWNGDGPESPIRGIVSMIGLEDGTTWVVSVADSLAALETDRRQIRQSLLTTFALIGALGVVGAVLQASAVVRPLNRLRQEVAHRWDSHDALNPGDYPDEVSPLVADINTLLDRNREIVERGRRQAADLAHALKTPSAILRNELEALASANVDTAQARHALDRVDAQLTRSLARIRAANTGVTTRAMTSLPRSVERMMRLFRSMPDVRTKSITTDVPTDLQISMDAQDLEESLGNILENAVNWSKSAIRVTAGETERDIWLMVEDDGPGIPEQNRREALRSGGRLDSSAPGTGLGLAIAADLAQAYGGEIALDHSARLGGLSVRISVPKRHGLTPQDA
jgi:signal transduction histidine kinase